MERIYNLETIKYIGKQVKVCGWTQRVRSHGQIIFIDLRDKSGILQLVFTPKEKELYETAQKIRPEWVIGIEGVITERPKTMINPKIETGKVELHPEKLEIFSEAKTLPFDFQDLKVNLPVLLDFRPLTLRNEKIKAIFKIQEQIIYTFRNTLKEMNFTEFQAPMIVPSNAEGGAEVFHIDYYKHDAYLAQSPQLYKQILVGVFEKVFTVTHVFRAEPSITTRHLSEYISLDAEMGFINSWEDLMDTCEKLIKNIFSGLQNNCTKELEMYQAILPKISEKIPRLKMREAQEIIFQRTGRDNRKEIDLEPEDEKEICKFTKEKYNSELVFITHYPTKKRPFYTFADPKDPEYTLSFDLLCRGLEIVTGGQRINDYEKLVDNLKKWGNKVENFEFYLQTFKYGFPPEGGFALGTERIAKQVLGLENVREASLFPRDMERIDQRLSILQPKKKKKTKTSKKSKK